MISFLLAVTLSILASSCSGISTTFICDPSKRTNFTALVNEPIFLISDKFPASEGASWTCTFQTELSDTINHSLSLFFTRSSFPSAVSAGVLQTGCTVYDELHDVDTSYDNVYVYSSYNAIAVQSSSVCKVPQMSLRFDVRDFENHTLPSWSGFQAMALVVGNRMECPLSNGSYVLNAEDPLRIYFIASSHMIKDETLQLDSRECRWVFNAYDGLSIKVVIPRTALDRGETLTLKNITYGGLTALGNAVFYFDDSVEIRYSRNSRMETRDWGFTAMISAYKLVPATPQLNYTMTVTNMDEQHWVVNTSTVQKNVATITIDPGYEFQMSFDKFQVEQCCDLITLGTTKQSVHLGPGDFIALPASAALQTVTVSYEPDVTIEYAGFDLKFFGAKCDCLEMQQVVLTSDYTNSSLTFAINSPSSGDQRPYCSLMNCEYNVSIADDPSLANYSIVLFPSGELRPIVSDYLLFEYGNETYKLYAAFDQSVIWTLSKWAKIRFVSGESSITQHSNRYCPSYSWTIRAGLMNNNVASTTPELSTLPTPGSSKPTSSSGSGDDNGGSTTLSIQCAAKILFTCLIVQFLILHRDHL